MLRYADEAQEASREEEIGPVRSLCIFAELTSILALPRA
jgi:hypothetical protein